MTTTFINTPTFVIRNMIKRNDPKQPTRVIRASSINSPKENGTDRRNVVTTLTCLTVASVVGAPQIAVAQNWGTRSFIEERFFEPDLSPEDSAARIKQTAEGLHSLREMLETMAWRYVLFYIRLKQAYLDKDLRIAMSTLPPGRVDDYIKSANELVQNMALMDEYIRTPKVYESYLYYEKTLKAIDDVVAILA